MNIHLKKIGAPLRREWVNIVCVYIHTYSLTTSDPQNTHQNPNPIFT